MKNTTQEALKEQETVVKTVELVPSRNPLSSDSEGAFCWLMERIDSFSSMLVLHQKQMCLFHQRQEQLIELLIGEIRDSRSKEPDGLMSYYDVGLYMKLSGKNKKSVVRAAQRIMHRFRVPKVRLGHRTVKFRPADIEKLKSRLAGDQMWRE